MKEKYKMFTLTENLSTEKNLAENVSSVKCEEMETAVEMEDAGNAGKSPKKDSEMETKIQELRLLLLQAGDEGRIKNFEKFVLNQESC